MPVDIAYLPATTTMTVDQALASAAQMDMTECVIIGYDAEGDLVVRSSRMDRADALWLVESAKQYVMLGSDEMRAPRVR